MPSDDSLEFDKLTGVSKVNRYKWTMTDEPGAFELIPKALLCVDHVYQRTDVKLDRIQSFAAEWSWIKCGALAVVRRSDGRYFVADGQHRKLAADRRVDIVRLPCLVFGSRGLASEAADFVQLNSTKSVVSATSKFKALIVAGDAATLGVRDLLATTNHVIGAKASATVVTCPLGLIRMWRADAALLAKVWLLVARVCAGRPLHSDIIEGVFYLAQKFPGTDAGALQSKFETRLLLAGRDGCMSAIQSARSYYKRGGPRVYADGLCKILNNRVRSADQISVFS